MKLFVVMHSHQYGVDWHFCKCAKEPKVKQVVERLDIDYEPEREETIEIVQVPAERNVKFVSTET